MTCKKTYVNKQKPSRANHMHFMGECVTKEILTEENSKQNFERYDREKQEKVHKKRECFTLEET